VEYIADFNPSTFVSTMVLSNRYLLVPPNVADKGKVFAGQSSEQQRQFMNSRRNVSEWMVVPKPMFDMTGRGCNKIGITYTGFRNQETFCQREFGRQVQHIKPTLYPIMYYNSCLDNQPYLLWKREKVHLQCLLHMYSYSTVF